jgi:membrane protease YdiL (CAAX protease family)
MSRPLLASLSPALVVAALWALAAYFSLASARVRAWWRPWRLAVLAPAPWLIYTLGCGLFDPRAFLVNAVLIAVAAYWFVLLPAGRLTDFAFIAWMAAPILLRWFVPLYPAPAPRVPTETLGHVVWIQVGLATVMNTRRMELGFGFWPDARQWREGGRWFLIALPPLGAVALGLGFVHLVWPATALKWLAGGASFFGILWVVALSEELFFRALLQRWIEDWSGRFALALVIASALFGAAHLGYRGFPNWRMALTATLLGAACGLAYKRAGVRAAMVTHAALVTVWKLFFR